jgi:signal transduction histidine kinase
VATPAQALRLVSDTPPHGAVVTVPIVVDGQTVGTVSVTFPESGLTRAQQNALDALTRNLVLAGAGAALLALAVSVFVSRRITRPLAGLADAVHAVEEGDRSDRPELARAPGELGELGGSVRRLVGRLDQQETSRRTMVRDVAHELRTPLTILRGSLEELVDGYSEPTPQRLASLNDEVLRLTRVVEDLDALAAADTASMQLRLEPVDLADLATAALDSVAGRAADAGL